MKVFDFVSPDYVKFCEKKYNIKSGCNNIKLNTLYSYRSQENELLRDKGEGEFSYYVNFPELMEPSPEWLSSFELDGPGDIEVEDVRIDYGRVRVKGFSLSGSTPNCWIYCMSKSIGSAGSITEAYEDKWTIEATKFQDFVRCIVDALFNSLTVKDIPQNLLEKYSIVQLRERLSMNAEFRGVEYVDRSVTITAPDDFDVLKARELSDSIAFKKPKEFAAEQEIRIAFWLMFDGKKISVVDQPKYINLRPIDNIF